MLALSLLKCSPKSYFFLQVLFPLPSRRTLQSVLSAVHFAAGVNAHVFCTLQHALQKMSDRDQHCYLLSEMNRPVEKMENLLSSLRREKMKKRKNSGTGKGEYF
jgi:cell shape-determining protein MreC